MSFDFSVMHKLDEHQTTIYNFTADVPAVCVWVALGLLAIAVIVVVKHTILDS